MELNCGIVGVEVGFSQLPLECLSDDGQGSASSSFFRASSSSSGFATMIRVMSLANCTVAPRLTKIDFLDSHPSAHPAFAPRARAPAPASIIFLMFTGLSLSSPVSKRSTSYPPHSLTGENRKGRNMHPPHTKYTFTDASRWLPHTAIRPRIGGTGHPATMVTHPSVSGSAY